MSTIKPISYENTIKTLRGTIIESVGMKPESVLNALSARGTDLSQQISASKSYSHSLDNSFMLFELLIDTSSEDNYVTPKSDGSLLAITSYVFHMLVYGNGSDICAKRVRATFKDPSIAQKLREKGLFIKGIDPGTTINEFVNNTMLLRIDLNLRLTSTETIENVSEQEFFSADGFLGEATGLIVRDVDEV